MEQEPIPAGRAFWEDLLLPALPEFSDTYAKELDFYGDSFLDHLMFAALGRFVVQLWRSEQVARKAPTGTKGANRRNTKARVAPASERAFGALEEGLLRGSHDLREPIIVSFVENLPMDLDESEVSRFRASLPPNLMSAWGAVECWRNQPHRTDPEIPYKRIHWEPLGTTKRTSRP